MSNKNVVITSPEVNKEILRRLENNTNSIFLYDSTDQSIIAIDKPLIQSIKRYYE